MRQVFFKLEKFYRLRRLEKCLGLYDDEANPKYPGRDPEYNLKAYMTSWEGIKPNQNFNFK